LASFHVLPVLPKPHGLHGVFVFYVVMGTHGAVYKLMNLGPFRVMRRVMEAVMRLSLPLTELKIRNLSPKDKNYKEFDGGSPGLYLEVLATGTKSWRVKY
ncbi:MAG: Arm DNA-binding domain-containing protein, partial [Deltaproteobacteria bacterium]|nr:Arm DNA-binding domain-containing protein [Deltaproteobacteria bacterium]